MGYKEAHPEAEEEGQLRKKKKGRRKKEDDAEEDEDEEEEEEDDESESEDSDERREAKRLRKLKRLRRKDKTIPRKPTSVYSVFCDEHRAEMMQSLPAGANKMSGVAKVASARWKALTAAEKFPYEEKFEAQKAAYAVAWAAYKEAHPEAEEAGRLR